MAHFQRRIIFAAILIHVFVMVATSEPVAIPTPSPSAIAYQKISDFVWGSNQILTLLLPVAAIVAASRLRVATATNRKYLTFTLVAAIFLFLRWLIQMPLERLRVNALNQAKNAVGPSFAAWSVDRFLDSLPTIIVSILVSLLVFLIINKSPRRWWLWTTAVFSLLALVVLTGEPLTQEHRPIGNSPIEIKIADLAMRAGVPPDSIFLEKCEPFDSCDIAHVSGLGPTRVILLNEELLARYPEDWTIQTVAHEAKHLVADDNLVGWIVLTLIFSAFFGLANLVCRKLIFCFPKQLGLTSIGDPLAFPLMILVLNLVYLTALPPINLFRQHVEFEADRFALELTHKNRAFAEMVSGWTTESKTRVPSPSRFFMLFRSSHPSDAERIAFANEDQSKNK